MPRAINKEKLAQFFAGIETLKSGYCYDDRYKFNRRLFDRPRICVFTNVEPDLKLLSKDMWKLWTVTDGQLVNYNPIVQENKNKNKNNNNNNKKYMSEFSDTSDFDSDYNDLVIDKQYKHNYSTAINVPKPTNGVVKARPFGLVTTPYTNK